MNIARGACAQCWMCEPKTKRAHAWWHEKVSGNTCHDSTTTLCPLIVKSLTTLGRPIASNTLHKLNNTSDQSMKITIHHDHAMSDLVATPQVDVCQAGATCSESLDSFIGDLMQQTNSHTNSRLRNIVLAGRTPSGHTSAHAFVPGNTHAML
jgi:hypothetical protein